MSHPWEEKWRLGERLGKGGQGATHKVNSIDGQTEGVLKKLVNNKSLSARARMHREAANLQILNLIEEAKVPQFLDGNTSVHEDGRTELYIVTEFIDGPLLKQYLEVNGVMNLDDAIDVTLKIGSTLQASHNEQILHRDLKPDNVILQGGRISEPVLIDFGLSFNSQDDDVTQTEETFRNKFLDLPETNTPGGDLRDARSDVTALAAIFYYLLTGERVGQLRDSNGQAPHRKIDKELRLSLDDNRAGQVDVLLDRAFQTSIADRFQSVLEFEERLKAIKSSSGGNDDLTTLAQRAMTRLREGDRKTQLAEMLNHLSPIFERMWQVCNEIGAQIAPFKLSINHNSGGTIPENYDQLGQTHLRVVLGSPGGDLAALDFALCCVGQECVILHRPLFPGEGYMKWDESAASWTESCWLSKDSDDPVDCFKTAVAESVGAVLEQIVTRK